METETLQYTFTQKNAVITDSLYDFTILIGEQHLEVSNPDACDKLDKSSTIFKANSKYSNTKAVNYRHYNQT